jgi:5'-3' exonuclease
MNQPVKKSVTENSDNPYLPHEEPEYILIIDGNGLLKGSMYDNCPSNLNGIKIGWIMNFLWKIRTMLDQRTFSKVYCTWDGENSGILRYNLYPDYKKNRHKNYSEYDRQINAFVYNVLERQKKKNEILEKQKDKEKYLQREKQKEQENENFIKCKMLLHEMLEDLFIRQIQDNAEGTESDDIIAYITLNKRPNHKICIITGDRDIHQLINEDVAIYDHRKKMVYHVGNYRKEFGMPIENILVEKILCGDSSDSIAGVKGLGDKTIEKFYPELYSDVITIEKIVEKTKLLMEEKPLKVFQKLIEEHEDGSLELRRKIIDLKEPLLGREIKDELDELMQSPLYPDDRNFDNVYRIINREEITDLKGDKFSSFFTPFQKLIAKEKLFYKKSGFSEINYH